MKYDLTFKTMQLPPIINFTGPTPMQKWIAQLDKYVRIPHRFSMHDFYLRCIKSPKEDGWTSWYTNPIRPHISQIIKQRPHYRPAGLFDQLSRIYATPNTGIEFKLTTDKAAKDLFEVAVAFNKYMQDVLKIPNYGMPRAGKSAGRQYDGIATHLLNGGAILYSSEMDSRDITQHLNKIYPEVIEIKKIHPFTDKDYEVHLKKKPKPWESNFDNRGGKKNKRNRKY